MKAITVIHSRNNHLSKGQLALYELILEANKKKFVIGKERLKMVYLNNVQRSPDYYNPWHKRIELPNGKVEHQGGYEPRSEWATNINCMTWFTNALGALIKKGYLTVIPRFNLKDAKELSG